MDFKYFLAPEDSMLDIEQNVAQLPVLPNCSLCGQQSRCFLIAVDEDEEGQVRDNAGFFLAENETIENFTVISGKPENPWEPDFFYRGCMECLRQGRFTVWHYTDVGEIENGEFTSESKRGLTIAKESILELSRTPSFSTFQQAIWLSHCNDFMAYLGEWEREDFNKNAPEGEGQKLFGEVEQAEPGEEWVKLRDSGFYLFRCLHCGKMRSFSDWD